MSLQLLLQKAANAGMYAGESNSCYGCVQMVHPYVRSPEPSVSNKLSIRILILEDDQVNLLFRTPVSDLVPGVDGQIRWFRLIAENWDEAWDWIVKFKDSFIRHELKQSFEMLTMILIPAKRMIPEDDDFLITYRGDISFGKEYTAHNI